MIIFPVVFPPIGVVGLLSKAWMLEGMTLAFFVFLEKRLGNKVFYSAEGLFNGLLSVLDKYCLDSGLSCHEKRLLSDGLGRWTAALLGGGDDSWNKARELFLAHLCRQSRSGW